MADIEEELRGALEEKLQTQLQIYSRESQITTSSSKSRRPDRIQPVLELIDSKVGLKLCCDC